MGNEFYRLTYVPDKGEDGKWGIVDRNNTIAYEYIFDTEDEAGFVADYHNGHPNADYERDILPAWNLHKKFIAPADADAPAAGRAGAGEADAPRTDLDADTLDHWPRMFRERCTADHWKGLYNDAAKNDMLDALDVIATLKQQLAAANDELSKAKSREKMYKHTVELHEEQYHQERDNARVLYRELRQHVSREQLEAIQKQLNNNVNEYDKLMSDASRGREALAKLAAAEADNARLREALLFCDTSLGAIEDYADKPESQSVNAASMTIEERMGGVLSQALAAHDVVEEALAVQQGGE